ncbi:hypothetical protein PR002_g8378 [Phytophthora rubi]|uniref:Uncharacterized protein n=1 Tax=Phytophthora rubi TaxID=129364 RepID=A0A6A3MXS4_9STRA|nr:hypothetical protein PR002_g8378 [Phytophthora rubi]
MGESIDDEEIEAHYDEPAQLSRRTRRTPAEAENVTEIMRSTHFSREEVEAINGSASLTDRRHSERTQARELSAAFLCLAEVIKEPLNMADTRRSPQWPEWERAVYVEIKALEDIDTFELVTLRQARERWITQSSSASSSPPTDRLRSSRPEATVKCTSWTTSRLTPQSSTWSEDMCDCCVRLKVLLQDDNISEEDR